MPKTQIGLIRLGPTGIELARNLIEKGFEVSIWDKETGEALWQGITKRT